MPTDKVLNLPLSGDEVIEILLQRIEHRLRHDCFLHPAATYNGFSYDLTLNIKFRDMMMGKETLIWDRHIENEVQVQASELENYTHERDVEQKAAEKFESGDSPNRTRIEHDLLVPVQTQEGRRTVIRKRKFAKEGE